MLKKVGEYNNKEIREFIKLNSHFTDGMIADHFNVSTRVIAANKAHITMGTDTDNPQVRAKANRLTKTLKKQLTIIKTNTYQLLIDEDGQYRRLDLKSRKANMISDEQAKAIILNRLHETYNM